MEKPGDYPGEFPQYGEVPDQGLWRAFLRGYFLQVTRENMEGLMDNGGRVLLLEQLDYVLVRRGGKSAAQEALAGCVGLAGMVSLLKAVTRYVFYPVHILASLDKLPHNVAQIARVSGEPLSVRR